MDDEEVPVWELGESWLPKFDFLIESLSPFLVSQTLSIVNLTYKQKLITLSKSQSGFVRQNVMLLQLHRQQFTFKIVTVNNVSNMFTK
jgi:hypothetical protein